MLDQERIGAFLFVMPAAGRRNKRFEERPMAQRWPIDFPHKILVPQRPRYLLARPHLTALLGTITERRLIILAAPAGYGKTSLLIDFATSAITTLICWYTLDRLDEDPWIFIGYLVAAIVQRFPKALQQTKELIGGANRPPFATIVAALIHDVYAIDKDFTIIFDDWHLVDSIADISQVIAQLLLHCPSCHIILASRTYPSMPDLMLLVARQQLGGLSAQHLRFSAAEAALVLNGEDIPAISNEQVSALVEQTNGWITGMLLSRRASTSATRVQAQSDARTERQVYRFLAEQVFDQQSAELRAFLLDTALLEDLTAERCDATFGRNDSARLLETLLQHHGCAITRCSASFSMSIIVRSIRSATARQPCGSPTPT
jgi:LuxR family transcriptional regulator, maltose regulon positive regulatory protein